MITNIFFSLKTFLETQVARLTEEARTTLRESEEKLEKKFLAELETQTSLTNLYKSRFDEHSVEHKAKVENHGKIITGLENMLKDQNRIMIDQLQNMSKRVSEVTTSTCCRISEHSAFTNRCRIALELMFIRCILGVE